MLLPRDNEKNLINVKVPVQKTGIFFVPNYAKAHSDTGVRGLFHQVDAQHFLAEVVAEECKKQQAIGRSRAGLTTKLHLVCEGKALPLAMVAISPIVVAVQQYSMR